MAALRSCRPFAAAAAAAAPDGSQHAAAAVALAAVGLVGGPVQAGVRTRDRPRSVTLAVKPRLSRPLLASTILLGLTSPAVHQQYRVVDASTVQWRYNSSWAGGQEINESTAQSTCRRRSSSAALHCTELPRVAPTMYHARLVQVVDAQGNLPCGTQQRPQADMQGAQGGAQREELGLVDGLAQGPHLTELREVQGAAVQGAVQGGQARQGLGCMFDWKLGEGPARK